MSLWDNCCTQKVLKLCVCPFDALALNSWRNCVVPFPLHVKVACPTRLLVTKNMACKTSELFLSKRLCVCRLFSLLFLSSSARTRGSTGRQSDGLYRVGVPATSIRISWHIIHSALYGEYDMLAWTWSCSFYFSISVISVSILGLPPEWEVKERETMEKKSTTNGRWGKWILLPIRVPIQGWPRWPSFLTANCHLHPM